MKRIALAVIAAAVVGGPVAAAQDGGDGARRAREILATRRITLDFTNARLDEVIAYLQEFSGLNFHIDADARKDREEDKVSIKLKDVTLRTALRLILNPRELACTYRDGVLVITTQARLSASTVTRVYDVRDLMFKLQDFPAPRFELDPQKPGLDPGLLQIAEEPKGGFEADAIIDLVKTSVGRGWDDGNEVSISMANGLLVVSQTRSTQDEIRRFLDLLRQYK